MITTVFSGNSRVEKTILAIHLAALRACEHRDVLFIDAVRQKHAFLWSLRRSTKLSKLHLPVQPIVDISLYAALGQLHLHRQDVVIDANGMDEADTRTALVVAHTVVVPLFTQPRDEQAEAMVAGLLERVRIFNPLLRVVLVVVNSENGEKSNAHTEVGILAGRIHAATVAHTLVVDSFSLRSAFSQGLTLFEIQPSDELVIERMKRLGQEVFGVVEQAPGGMEGIKVAMAALKGWNRQDRHRNWFHRDVR